MINSKKCNVCNHKNVSKIQIYRGYKIPFLNLNIFRCRNCFLEFAYPPPLNEHIEVYNKFYFKNAHGTKNAEVNKIKYFSGIAKIRYNHIQRFAKIKNYTFSRVLEIGPGHGFLAREILSSSYITKYYALETDISCHEQLKKLGVTLLRSNEAFPKVDLLILSHVLEHVAKPLEFLTKFSLSLKKQGLLFVEVPVRDYLYKTLDEPHLIFFDKRPLETLLKKVGFNEIYFSYHGQKIQNLVKGSRLKSILQNLRSHLIRLGLVGPFASFEPGLEGLNNQERAVVKPWQAHRESEEPAWWLRAVAIKP